MVPTASEDEPEVVQEVRAAIEDHLADPDLSVDQLASEVAVSRSTLYRRLNEQADATPSQFIQQVRVEHGARLLREAEGTISEVAYAVGFESLSYFSRQFRKHLDQSPPSTSKRSDDARPAPLTGSAHLGAAFKTGAAGRGPLMGGGLLPTLQ